MKQDNVFRFVALRAPEPTEPTTSQLPPGSSVPLGSSVPQRPPRARFDDSEPLNIGAADARFVVLIRRLREQGIPLDEARQQVANAFIASSANVLRNPVWLARFALTDQLAALVKSASTPETAAIFREALQAMLRSADREFDLSDYLDSPAYRNDRRDLWYTFYAHIIIPLRNPNQYGLLLFWVRIFELMETIRLDGNVAALLAQFDEIQPVIPYVVGRTSPIKSTDAAESNGSGEAAASIASLRKEIAELQEARTALSRRLTEKLAAFTPDLAPAKGRAASSTTATISEGDAAEIPWRIADSDLSAATARVLDHENVTTRNRSFPQIIQELERAIARRYATLSRSTRKDAVINLGSVLVRRKGTR